MEESRWCIQGISDITLLLLQIFLAKTRWFIFRVCVAFGNRLLYPPSWRLEMSNKEWQCSCFHPPWGSQARTMILSFSLKNPSVVLSSSMVRGPFFLCHKQEVVSNSEFGLKLAGDPDSDKHTKSFYVAIWRNSPKGPPTKKYMDCLLIWR